MDCDYKDLSRNFSEAILEEYQLMINFKNSGKEIARLTENYQIAGASVGVILGTLLKGLAEEKRKEKFDELWGSFVLVLKHEIHPIDFWGELEKIVLDRCLKLQEWFIRIQDSNKNNKILGTLSKILVFAGNTVTGGLAGEIKTAFEGLFSVLGKVSEQVSTPKNFEELCCRQTECSCCFKILNDARSKRIYYPVCGTRFVKSLCWTLFCLTDISLKTPRMEHFETVGTFKIMWEDQVNFAISTFEGGIVDSNFDLTIFGEEQGLKGTILDNSVPKESWKEINEFYNPITNESWSKILKFYGRCRMSGEN